MDYSAILFKFRSCMEEIGDALREVLGTNDKYKFTEIATSIKTCNQVYYLGTGTSFDVSGIPGYQNLTADNFIAGISHVGNTNSKLPYRDDISGGISGTTVGKTYDASTGKLTITGNNIRFVGYEVGTQTATTTFFAYLIKGKIKNA